MKRLTPLGVEKVSLLGYHEWGKPKYEFLGRIYPCNGKEAPDDDDYLEHLKQIMEHSGLEVTIGH